MSNKQKRARFWKKKSENPEKLGKQYGSSTYTNRSYEIKNQSSNGNLENKQTKHNNEIMMQQLM